MEDVRIAAVQMQSSVGEISKNLKKMEEFIKKAHAQTVDIICFPELSIQGYTLKKAKDLAEPLHGQSCNYLQGLSEKHNIIILAGLIEKSESKPFITQAVIYPDGRIDKYRKTHLGVTEQHYFRPADKVKTFSYSKAKFGIQLCFDCHFPEVTTIQALQGAEVVFLPHATPMSLEKRKESWLKYLPARAYDNSLYLVTCNHYGDNGEGINYQGGCMVFDPLGNLIAETSDKDEEMLVVTLKSSKLDSIRKNKSDLMRNRFYLESRRPEIYGEIIKNIEND
ncbi:MAG: hypothetical protein PWQ96_1698 [Clostridia bacterium]|jgi:predicted amidohydrolase|nr:Nitrilase/cyanide hydratase and apolipoprotein N-acyltransferase [Clostridiales bacterium]MDK2986055.1 hypothetical protein [Clostridia bacterium]